MRVGRGMDSANARRQLERSRGLERQPAVGDAPLAAEKHDVRRFDADAGQHRERFRVADGR